MKKKITGKDLTKEAPRSPRIRVGGYAIPGRTIDKCRALVAGNIGEYHFDCPLDNMLLGVQRRNGRRFQSANRARRKRPGDARLAQYKRRGESAGGNQTLGRTGGDQQSL